MGEKSDQIAREIEQQRSELGNNISELQHKVKSAVDWRAQFQEKPMTMIGIAFGAGVLLSTIVGGRSKSSEWHRSGGGRAGSSQDTSSSSQLESTPGTAYQKRKASDTWDNIKGALIGVTASRFKEFLEEIVPGFREQYRKRETVKGFEVRETPPTEVPIVEA